MSRLGRLGFVLIAASLALNAVTLTAAMAASGDYYLQGDGIPVASLSTAAPPDIALPDYDSWRDANPGILVQEGGSGPNETDPTRFQQWQIDVSGATLGVNNLTIWAMAADGAPGGEFTAYLLRCSVSCVVVTSTTKSVAQGLTWKQLTAPLAAPIDTYAAGERLVVKIVVPSSSSSDLCFAYGTEIYAAALKMNVTAPPTTTTTTSTTTTSTSSTTLPPSTTSTTTTAPGPTTTTSAASTTSSAGSAATTTAGAGATTTLAGAGTTEPGSAGDPGTATYTPGDSSPDATPIAIGDPGTEMIVDASGTGIADNVFGTTKRLSPQQGLAVSFLSAAEAFRSQFLASTGLGVVGALLVVFGMRRKVDEEDE